MADVMWRCDIFMLFLCINISRLSSSRYLVVRLLAEMAHNSRLVRSFRL
jgi:hypothetical protein